jgi:hypothetical protein
MVIQVAAEVLIELGLESVGDALKKRQNANPYLAVIGFATLGSVSGAIASLIFARRLVPNIDLHGLSIVIAAISNGFLMMQYGKWRQSKGGNPSYLATFWGGALFASFMALTRWLMIGN